MPASARTSPSCGRITAMPPKRPASASTAARWTSGSIVVRTALPLRGSTEASTRSPARSSPPGVPVSSASNSRSRPVTPTGAPGGTPRRASSTARSGGAGPTRPAISDASAPSSDRRASPSASGVPSRAWIVARGGIVGAAGQPLAGPQAGVDEVAVPVDRRAVVALHHGQRDPALDRAEDPGAQRDRHDDGPVASVPPPSRRSPPRASTASPRCGRRRRSACCRSPRASSGVSSRASRRSRRAPTRRRSAAAVVRRGSSLPGADRDAGDEREPGGGEQRGEARPHDAPPATAAWRSGGGGTVRGARGGGHALAQSCPARRFPPACGPRIGARRSLYARSSLTGVDWIIVGLVLLLALFGWAQGFISGVLALVGPRARRVDRHAGSGRCCCRRASTRRTRPRSACSAR